MLSVVFDTVSDPTVANVQVTRMSLMCETAPNPLILDLQGEFPFGLVYEAEIEFTCSLKCLPSDHFAIFWSL